MRDFPQLASRLFDTPLLIDARKVDSIAPVLLRRMQGLESLEPDPSDRAQTHRDGAPHSGIAVIPIIGSLVRRGDFMDAWSGLTTYGDIAASLDRAMADDRVKGIMLQLDTFGGEAGGVFELCDRIWKAGQVKPIWASADINALSAGYAIASQCKQLWVAPSGALGSIGVVAVHCEQSAQDEMIGLAYTVFRSGQRKADGNPYEPLAKQFGEKLQLSMDRNRQTFARKVARGRPGLGTPAILATEGQWYDAIDCPGLKLCDQIGTFEAAFAAFAAELPAPAARPPHQPLAPPDPDDDEPSQPAVVAVPAQGEHAMNDTTLIPPAPAPAAAVPVPPPAPAASNVVELDAARAQGATQRSAEVSQIVELCSLAGVPAKAGEFIVTGASLADVRKALVDAKQEADKKLGEVSNHQPAIDKSTPAAAMAAWDGAFDKVHATTSRQLGRRR